MLFRILKLIKTKYYIATVAFVVWITFFDSNSLILQARLSSQLNDLKREKQFYLDEINENTASLEKLLNDKGVLEKFAREKYLMKKEDEDIYVIIRE